MRAAQALVTGCTASAYQVSTTPAPDAVAALRRALSSTAALALVGVRLRGYTRSFLAAVLDDLPAAQRFAALSRRARRGARRRRRACARRDPAGKGVCDARCFSGRSRTSSPTSRRAAALGDGEYAALNAH
ncbi:MAG: hypothetical protein IPN17_35055 [Deltaproteobacteria bacterium]|nr:hypothetical protein [Deltaproteobacteria bacterium]